VAEKLKELQREKGSKNSKTESATETPQMLYRDRASERRKQHGYDPGWETKFSDKK